MATVCRCEDGKSFFNCTNEPNQKKIKTYRTTGKDSCATSDGFARRRRRSTDDDDVEDDDVILPDDFPVPPAPNVTEFGPSPSWPTPSGITEEQATDACLRVLESYTKFSICRQYVDIESVVRGCAINIQVRSKHMIIVLVVTQHIAKISVYFIELQVFLQEFSIYDSSRTLHPQRLMYG